MPFNMISLYLQQSTVTHLRQKFQGMDATGSQDPPPTPFTLQQSTLRAQNPYPWQSHPLHSGSFSYYSPSPMPAPSLLQSTPKPSQCSKKRNSDKENLNDSRAPKRHTLKSALNITQKLALFYGFLDTDLGWTYGELLHHTFLDFTGLPDAPKMNLGIKMASRKQMAATMQHFFNGHRTYTPLGIVSNWLRHPYGCHQRDSPDMYSMTVSYLDIKPIRPMLTSFAAQTVSKWLISEAENAIKPVNGLCVSFLADGDQNTELAWMDIGAATIERAQETVQAIQPLTWALIIKIATHPPQIENGVRVIRQKRPADIVSPQPSFELILSNLSFYI